MLKVHSQAFPTVRLLMLAVCKNGGERPGPFYHVNEISVYLGRQRWGGEGSSIQQTLLWCFKETVFEERSQCRPRLTGSSKNLIQMQMRKIKHGDASHL